MVKKNGIREDKETLRCIYNLENYFSKNYFNFLNKKNKNLL